MESLFIQPPKHSIWDNFVPIIREGRTTTAYLTDNIESPANYNELCHVLLNAYEGDTIIMDINNGGGHSSSAFMITNAMTQCKAHIKGRLSGVVASAATIITMHCDELEVAPYTEFMIHNYFHGTQGTGNQVKEYVNFTDSEFTKAVKKIYAGFITPEEMDQVSKQDKELWFGADETIERWTAKLQYDLGMTEETK